MVLMQRISLGDESGQTMAEYAFVLSVIIVTIIVAFGVLSGAIATSIDGAVTIIRSL
jgi:Flp pilus assembly pilin Flp